MNNKFSAKSLAKIAVIAALYATCTFIFAPISYGAIQFRIAECLCVLAFFYGEGVIGLTIGCFIANIFGNGPLDIIFGTFATFISALLSRIIAKQIKKNFKEIIFIAEVYNPNEYRNYIFNGQFDFLYDKVGLYDTLRAATRHEASASQITSCWQSIDDIKSHMLNFLENHDEQRIASSFFIGDAWKSIPALVVSATLHSSPFMVYAGQELGESGMDEEGFSGRDGRTTIFDYWKVDTLSRQYNDGDFSDDLLSDDEIALRNVYKKILQLRLKEDALQNDASLYDLTWLNFNNSQFDTNKQFAYLRQNGEQTLLIVVNFADYPVELGINISAHALQYLNFPLEKMTKVKDLLTGERFKQLLSAESPFAVSVEARNARILEIKRRVKNTNIKNSVYMLNSILIPKWELSLAKSLWSNPLSENPKRNFLVLNK